MRKPVYTTDTNFIHFIDCDPANYKKAVFDMCSLSIIEGVNTLTSVSLCDFQLEGLGSDTLNGGCGGSSDRRIEIPAKSNYTLTAPEVGQAQGEVQMIVVKVKYSDKIDSDARYLTWEYKGNVYPINTLMILTGRTKADEAWQGWDLSSYAPTPPSPDFSPGTFPSVGDTDLDFGGILFNNPSEYPVDLEILIFN